MPLPEFLTRRGIVSVADNVPAGQQVRATATLFMALFQDELMAATTRRGSHTPATRGIDRTPNGDAR